MALFLVSAAAVSVPRWLAQQLYMSEAGQRFCVALRFVAVRCAAFRNDARDLGYGVEFPIRSFPAN